MTQKYTFFVNCVKSKSDFTYRKDAKPKALYITANGKNRRDMAGRYTKAELKEKLQRSAFHITAEEGLEKVTVRKLTRGCGLSDPYLYQCYADMAELVQDAFLKVDKEVGDMIDGMLEGYLADNISSEEMHDLFCTMWKKYWEYLLNDPEKTIFYWRFYQSGYYTKEVLQKRLQNFTVFTNVVSKSSSGVGTPETEAIKVLIDDIIDLTAGMAVKVHLGFAKRDAVREEAFVGSIYVMLFHFLHLMTQV